MTTNVTQNLKSRTLFTSYPVVGKSIQTGSLVVFKAAGEGIVMHVPEDMTDEQKYSAGERSAGRVRASAQFLRYKSDWDMTKFDPVDTPVTFTFTNEGQAGAAGASGDA